MMAVLITLLYLGILVLDFRPNLRGARRRDKVVYLAILTTGCALAAMQTMGVNVASPAYPIQRAVHALFGVQ